MKHDLNSDTKISSSVQEAVDQALENTRAHTGAAPKEIFYAACAFFIFGFLLVNFIPVPQSGVVIGYALIGIGVLTIFLLNGKS